MKATSQILFNTVFIITFLLLPQTINANANANEKAKEMDAFVERFHDFKQFNGNVLVAKQGKVIFEKSYGHANFEWDLKNTSQTKFRIGSITKQFTAVLVLQLVQQNKIQLDEPLSTYLPNYRKDIGNKITIRQILNHTSGLSNYTHAKAFKDDYSRNPYNVDEFIALLCSDDLLFEPGTQFRYSNSGYFILGAVIEKVTQQTYQNVLQQNIFTPLNMRSTGYDSHEALIKQRASGYNNNLNGYTNAEYLDMSIPYAAGSIYSTTHDLVKWDQALYSNQLLNNELKSQMYSASAQRNYGLGWEVNSLDAKRYGKAMTQVQHGGGINGFNAFISRILEDQLLIVILNNTGGAPLTPMTKGLTNIVYGKPYEVATKNVDSMLFEAIQRGGIRELNKKYAELTSQGGTPRERTINYFGYELLEMKLVKEAIAVFKLNVQTHPNSANAHDSLAEAYLVDGNTSKSLKFYQKALKLDPTSDNAAQAVKRLKIKTRNYGK